MSIDYSNIEPGDIVIEKYFDNPQHYYLIIRVEDDGLYTALDIQYDVEEIIDVKFDSHQMRRSYEIIKANKQ